MRQLFRMPIWTTLYRDSRLRLLWNHAGDLLCRWARRMPPKMFGEAPLQVCQLLPTSHVPREGELVEHWTLHRRTSCLRWFHVFEPPFKFGISNTQLTRNLLRDSASCSPRLSMTTHVFSGPSSELCTTRKFDAGRTQRSIQRISEKTSLTFRLCQVRSMVFRTRSMIFSVHVAV